MCVACRPWKDGTTVIAFQEWWEIPECGAAQAAAQAHAAALQAQLPHYAAQYAQYAGEGALEHLLREGDHADAAQAAALAQVRARPPDQPSLETNVTSPGPARVLMAQQGQAIGACGWASGFQCACAPATYCSHSCIVSCTHLPNPSMSVC